MAYGKKYILSFISDRGNDYKVEVLQQGFSGSAVSKKFGAAPVLNIEGGDGRVKGSSLAFSIQADVEAELSGLYTTDNKEYKVLLYRNDSLYWQGYLLPELYSENYVDPPYDVAVTATDQLATLKDIDYQGEDVQTSLLDIIKGILLNTKVDIPCKIHMQLSSAQGSLLKTSYLSAAAYNGQSCYDVLNAVLLSCNCCIMQLGNEWLIASYTDATTTYITEEGSEDVQHCTIGQMGKGDVCPDGSLTMVNAPALKGATVEYNHTLRKSILLNPNVINRDNWIYDATTVGDRFPGEVEGTDVVYKCYFWQLNQVNLAINSTPQVWQDIALDLDTTNAYGLSLKYLFTGLAEVLLLSVAYSSEYGTTWYLTGDGWETDVDRKNINSYIQITGEAKSDVLLLQDVSNMSNYETATVQFMLPDVPGTLRVGFINCTTDYSEPAPYRVDQIYITDIYLAIANVTGKTATTLVESNATSAQEEVVISYGEPISSANADKVDLSYLRGVDGQQIESVVLSGREYDSYYLAMVQDFSRYYGVKKMQLQGSLMGDDVLHPLYQDTFSGKVMRLVSGQYNLLEDTLGISLEEVPTAFVDYTLVVYAKDNTVSNNTTSTGGSVAVSGGDNYFGLQADGDVFVKNDRPLTGHESRFENVALPALAPSGVSSERTYIYSSDPESYPSIDLTSVAKKVDSNTSAIGKLATDIANRALQTSLDTHINTYNTFVNTTYAAHITAYNNHISAYNTHITEYNTFKTDTQKRLDALEALWAIDEENNGLYPKSGRGIWSESYITAGGVGKTDSGSGGLIQNVYGYGDLGGTFSNTNLTDTFNAYTINQLYTSGESIKSRIEVLESNMGVINPDTLLSLNNSIASNFNRITSIEDWINNPTAEVAYFNELGVRDKLNVSGPATFDERITGVITEAVNLTGTPEVKISENTIAILIGEKVSAYITVPYAVKALNDSNGSSIVDTYASKADVNSLTSTLADHLARIIGIEDALLYPSFDTLYTNELGIRDKLNVAGPTTFDSSVTADVFTGLATKAIADKNNNDITTTYALKLEIGAAIEQIAKLNDNITSIEDWMVNASAETLLVRELGVLDKINVSGPATFDDTTAFTGKTTHNGGIGATTGTFSSSLSAGATTLSSLNVTGASSLTTITATKITVTNSSSDAITVNGNVNISGTAWMGSLGSSNSKVNNAYITTANISTLYANSGQIYGNLRLKGDSSNYGNYLYFGDGPYCYIAELDDDEMTIYASSGLQITTNTNVTGNIYATGAITAGSDARYKSKLQDVAVDVEVIANAPLFDYKWKDREDNRTYLGTTAQYWNNTAFKNAVIPTTDEKLWTMSYSQIAMGNTIILARELLPIKRKVSEIDSLKDRLHKAERRIEVLEQELNQYRRA